jgi:N6-adenosine-specific RNA methylase IME4
MQLVTLDFETWWSQDHSLSKMLPMTYVMHPETEIISCSIKIGDAPTEVYFSEENIRAAFDEIDWADSYVAAHNMSGFDSMILAWRFGIKPKMWGCTLAMARPIHSITVGNSLKKLVEHYSLGVKDNTALMNTKGRHLCDFTEQEIKDMAKYNKDDTDQCYDLFQKLKPHFTSKELWHIDASIRQLVEPAFVVDTALLDRTLIAERDRKYQAVIELAELLGMDIEGDTSKVEEEVTTQLLSAAKFSEVLTARGVDVPTKPSPSNPEKRIPALAKTDNEFIALQEHDDPIVAAAALLYGMPIYCATCSTWPGMNGSG